MTAARTITLEPMELALVLAKKAAEAGEVPVGAVLTHDGKVIAQAYNLTKTRRDPTTHAEILVLQEGARLLQNERLLETVLYVTKEPCAMCAGAIVQARVPVLVYGASDDKMGACGSVVDVIPNKKLNHRPTVIKGVLAAESARLLKDFFRRKR